MHVFVCVYIRTYFLIKIYPTSSDINLYLNGLKHLATFLFGFCPSGNFYISKGYESLISFTKQNSLEMTGKMSLQNK